MAWQRIGAKPLSNAMKSKVHHSMIHNNIYKNAIKSWFNEITLYLSSASPVPSLSGGWWVTRSLGWHDWCCPMLVFNGSICDRSHIKHAMSIKCTSSSWIYTYGVMTTKIESKINIFFKQNLTNFLQEGILEKGIIICLHYNTVGLLDRDQESLEKTTPLPTKNIYRADSRFVPSQWETALLCNDVSHLLGASLELALCVYIYIYIYIYTYIHTSTIQHTHWQIVWGEIFLSYAVQGKQAVTLLGSVDM